MMSFLGLFGDDKLRTKAVDLVDDSVRGIGTWIDEMSFTEQERSQARQKMLDFRLQVLEKTADESTVRSLSRRFMAWAIVSSFLFLIISAALGIMIGQPWLTDMVQLIKLLHEPFWTVIGFYFVSHIGKEWIDKISNAKKN